MHCLFTYSYLSYAERHNLWMVMGDLRLMLLAAFLQITENGEVEITLHTVKTDGRVEVYIHAFLISAIDRGQWSVS